MTSNARQAPGKARQTATQAASKASKPHKAPAPPDSGPLLGDLAAGIAQDLREVLPDLIRAGAVVLLGAVAKQVIVWLERSNIPTPPVLAELEPVAEQATAVAAEAATALTKQAAAGAADTVVEVTEEAGGIPAMVGKAAASAVAGAVAK